MLLLSSSIIGKRVFSIRESRPIGEIIGVMCQPKNLKIEGFYVNEFGTKKIKILLSQDIREMYKQDFIANDVDALSEPSDLIKHQKLIELNFNLISKVVKTVSGRKIGKVEDFAFDSENMFILKLYVHQSLFKNFNGAVESVDRNQIVEVNDKYIVIEEIEKMVSVTSPATIS